MASNNHVVDCVHCISARDFLTTLSPIGGCYSSASPPNRNLYRGHSKASYKLVPTTLRQPAGDAKAQIDREIRLLGQFFRLADQQGLMIPEDGTLARSAFDRLGNQSHFIHRVQSAKQQWPPKELLPFLGIAQHHGIETRLLDWSRDALVAAYFAAVSAAERIYRQIPHGDSPEDNQICVWVLNWIPVEVHVESTNWRHEHTRRIRENARGMKIPDEVAGLFPAAPTTGIQVDFVTVPSASNRNLQAQKGIFSLLTVKSYEDAGAKVDYLDDRPLDQALMPICPDDSSFGETSDRDGCFQAPLTCVTLPSEFAPHLLYCLAHLGVSAATVFPGFGGVAAAVQEQKLFPPVVDPRGLVRKDAIQPIAIQART